MRYVMGRPNFIFFCGGVGRVSKSDNFFRSIKVPIKKRQGKEKKRKEKKKVVKSRLHTWPYFNFFILIKKK
jgi:hypothetical protein